MLIRKFSEHHLGNYLPPRDSEGNPTDNWIDWAWQKILATNLDVAEPKVQAWVNQLAKTGLSIAYPYILQWFSKWNRKAQKIVNYANCIKPYNQFVHVALASMQTSADERITLVSPLGVVSEKDDWFANIHDPEGKGYRVTSSRSTYPDTDTLFGETFADLIRKHRHSREIKFVDASGGKVTARTQGLLIRQHIMVGRVLHVGKEANEFELVQAGLVDQEEEVLNIYERDPWEELQSIMAKMVVEEIMRITGYRRRMAYAVKTGERRPARNIVQILCRVFTKCEGGKELSA